MGRGGSLPDGSGGRGARLGLRGREKRSRRPRDAVVRVLVLPDGDVKPPGRPVEQRVLESAL